MYFLQQLHVHEIKGTSLIFSLKIGSEVEFLISSGIFFQSSLALHAMLSKPNYFILGFWDLNLWKFLRLQVFSQSWCHSWYQKIGYSGIYKSESWEVLCIFGGLVFHLNSQEVLRNQKCSFVEWGAGTVHVCR